MSDGYPGLSYSSPKVVQMRDYVAAASDDVNLVFVVCKHLMSCRFYESLCSM